MNIFQDADNNADKNVEMAILLVAHSKENVALIVEPLLFKLFDKHYYTAATRLILGSVDLINDDPDKASYVFHLYLQLGYLLAISNEAREVIKPDDAEPKIAEAVAYVERTDRNDTERLGNAFVNLGSDSVGLHER